MVLPKRIGNTEMGKEVIPWVLSHKQLDPSTRYNQQLQRGIEFNIKKGDKVLDVGPMCFPFPLATHITGNDPRDDPKNGLPFVLADVQVRLPYPDKYFDYIYCSHVLEHLKHPIAGARELSRVGKRGYVEVPSGYSTMFLYYSEVHPLWFPYQDVDGTLVFTKWDPRILKFYGDLGARKAIDRIVNGDPDEEKLTLRERAIRAFFFLNGDLMYPSQQWEDSIRIRQGAWLG